jgi:hypothetical protein
MSDVTVPAVGSLLLFETGTVKTFTCTVAWGVRTAADSVAAGLVGDNLWVAAAGRSHKVTRPAVGQNLLTILGARENTEALARTYRATFGPELANTSEAKDLMQHLRGLLGHARGMDPAEPGWRAATQLAAAVAAYDALLDRAPDAFVANPPDEFLAIHSVLSRLVIAAMENEEREATEASERGAYGLACAPEPKPAPVRRIVQAPVERPVEMCVLVGSEFRNVSAIQDPTTGELYTMVQGERRPFQEVYPDRGPFAREAGWFTRGEPVQYRGVTFVAWGAPQRTTGEFERIGQFGGVDLFAADPEMFSDADLPSAEAVLFVPVSQGCVVQEYRMERQVRGTRG